MYRRHSDRTCGLTIAGLLVAILAGCATDPRTAEPARVAQRTTADAKPTRPARIEVDAAIGFTITEVVALPSEVRADYRDAMALLAQDAFERGIALLVGVTERVPEATGPFVDLGIAYSRAGRLEEAEASFNEALRLTPNHPVAHNELAIVYRRLGKFREARAHYEEALAVYPGYHYARRNLAVLCDLYLADLSCAVKHYETYQASVPDDPEVGIWLVDVRNRLPQ